MKSMIVFFVYSTGNIFLPQSENVTVRYSGLLAKELENIKKKAKETLKEKIGVHADNAVVTGMTPGSSVY